MKVSDFISDDAVKIDGKWYLIVLDAIDCERSAWQDVYVLRRIGYNPITKHMYLQNKAWIMSCATADGTEVEDALSTGSDTPELDNYGEYYEQIRKDVMKR